MLYYSTPWIPWTVCGRAICADRRRMNKLEKYVDLQFPCVRQHLKATVVYIFCSLECLVVSYRRRLARGNLLALVFLFLVVCCPLHHHLHYIPSIEIANSSHFICIALHEYTNIYIYISKKLRYHLLYFFLVAKSLLTYRIYIKHKIHNMPALKIRFAK